MKPVVIAGIGVIILIWAILAIAIFSPSPTAKDFHRPKHYIHIVDNHEYLLFYYHERDWIKAAAHKADCKYCKEK